VIGMLMADCTKWPYVPASRYINLVDLKFLAIKMC